MNKIYIFIISLMFSCTVKSNIYTVTAIQETPVGCTYTVTGGTMSMFIWNEPQIYIFEDECDLYEINTDVMCQTLNSEYNLDACRK